MEHREIDRLWTMARENAPSRIAMPRDIAGHLERWRTKRVEHVVVITLNGAHTIIRKRVVSVGILNRSLIHPREVYRDAIVEGGAAIIVAHNHPSGNLEPSEEDKGVALKLRDAGNILGITLLDFVIFGKIGLYSFLEGGHL